MVIGVSRMLNHRQLAREAGHTHYFTGRACCHGHLCKRRVSDGGCLDCGSRWARQHRNNQRPDNRTVVDCKFCGREFERRRCDKVYCSVSCKTTGCMWERQGLELPLYPKPDTCECCGDQPKGRSLHADHDHATKKFRGWLCHRCNTGIGSLGDSVGGVEQALAYLSSSNRDTNVRGGVPIVQHPASHEAVFLRLVGFSRPACMSGFSCEK